MAAKTKIAAPMEARVSSAPLGKWKVTGNNTVKVKTGTTPAFLRIYNEGPSQVIVKNVNTSIATIESGMACDVEGTVISVTGSNCSGTYARL